MVEENLRPFSPIASFSLIDPPCLIKIEAALSVDSPWMCKMLSAGTW